MPFDVKKAYRELYAPPATPSFIEVPAMRFVAVDGVGDPNETDGEYAQALQLLYGISFTIKMSVRSKRAEDHIDGYYAYVVPPLEGLWRMAGGAGTDDGGDGTIDYARKADFEWTSMIRLPEFVTDEVFAHARASFAAKHPEAPAERAYLLDFEEGPVVQAMHRGPYDDEPATIAALDAYAREHGYDLDCSATRRHHEIYLSDPRRCKPDNLKTVIRHPVKRR